MPGPADRSKLEGARRVLRWRLVGVRAQHTAALAEGFGGALPPSLSDLLARSSVEAVMLAGAAGRELSGHELLACMAFEGWASDESSDRTPALFCEWVHRAPPLERRRLLLLLTGRVSPAALPRLGSIGAGSSAHANALAKDRGPGLTASDGVLTVRLAPPRLTQGRPRALRASWELLLPSYPDGASLALAMAALLRSPPESLV